MARYCLDCVADISHRGPNAKRCEPCAATHAADQSRAYQARTRPRRCLDCYADISVRGSAAKRCELCQRQRTMARKARGEALADLAATPGAPTWPRRLPSGFIAEGPDDVIFDARVCDRFGAS